MQIEHEKLGVKADLKDPTQKMLEIYQEKLLEFSANAKGAAVYNSSIVRAAIEAGVLVGIDPAGIDGMSPKAVRYLSMKINDFMRESNQVPPE